MAAKARTLTLKTDVKVTGADQLNNLGKRMQSVGRNLTAGVTLPLIGLGGALLAMSEEAARADAELTRTFESMGASAWTTVDALKAQQQELQGLTTFADEDISHLQSVLLTFGNVAGDSFDRATKAALDMSTLLGQDLQSSAVQLGKALNDPIRGVTALRRVGVSFNEQQLEQIRLMTEAGDVAAAQGIILTEVERQFGGAAEAIADTAGGQLKQALNELGDAGEEFGAVMAPVLTTIADGLKAFAGWLKELNPETKEWVVRIGALLAVLGPVVLAVGSLVRVFSGLKGAGAAVISLAPKIGAAFSAMLGPIGLVVGAVAALAAAWVTDFAGLRSNTEDSVGILAIHFGELGDRANALADEMGVGFQQIKDQVSARMDETGESAEEALRRIERAATGMTEAQLEAAVESGRAWEDYQKTLSNAMYGTDGVVPTIIAGVDEAAGELGELPQKGADELLANQFMLTDAIDELIAFMDQALTPAEEVFNARMFLASAAAAEGLASNNPLVRQKTAEMIAEAQAVLDAFGKEAFNYGFNFSAAYAAGIVNNLGVVRDAGRQLGGALASQVAINSEPPDPNSPLAGITRWGANMVNTIASSIFSTLGTASGAAGALAGALAPSFGSVSALSAPAATPVMRGGDIHIHLNVDGDLTSDRERGVVDLIGRSMNVMGYSDRVLVGS